RESTSARYKFLMSTDFDDLGDDKSHVRSTLDALGDKLTKGGRPRGRPRKHLPPLNSHSKKKVETFTDESEEEEEMIDDGKKKKTRASDEEDWTEEQEALSNTQRREMRVRKRPTLYADEVAVSEAQRKRLSAAKRLITGQPARGRPTVKSPLVISPLACLPKKQQEELDRFRQKLSDIDHPKQAKERIFELFRKGYLEQGLARVLPKPGPRTSEVRIEDNWGETMAEVNKWRQEIMNMPCSAGFLEFIWHINVEIMTPLYLVIIELYEWAPGVDAAITTAQAVRFCWNSLPWATRRKWERVARKRVMQRMKLGMHGDAVFEGHEVPVSGLTEARLAAEEQWLNRRNKSLVAEVHEEDAVLCPLCDKDDQLDEVRLSSMQQIQEHFFHAHWQVHGYACHFCGTMYSTLEALKVDHTDCDEWMAWRAAGLLAGGNVTGKIEMTYGRMMLCCAECGWHVALSREKGAMEMVKAMMTHHHNSALLTMMIYFPVKPTEALDSVHFTVTPANVKNPPLVCNHCSPPVTFRDPCETDEHYQKHHSEMALKCGVCNALSATEFLFKQHQMGHVGEHLYLADYLSYSARVLPPPNNLSRAPRVGWKNKLDGNHAVGGMVGGIGLQSPIDIVDPFENCEERKIRNIRRQVAEGVQQIEDGYDRAAIEVEKPEARTVREKLMKKYSDCEGISGVDETCWLRTEDAEKFRAWMTYWESAEGKKKGGPPKEIEFDMSPSIINLPTVDVEINFRQTMEIASSCLLDDNVFYCMRCDVILKGAQAAEHLKKKEGKENVCAKQDNGVIEERPFSNDNMFTLHVPSSSDLHCPSVPCPHCASCVECCSITGLRLHLLQAHGIYAEYTPVAATADDSAMLPSLKWDLRTPFGKMIDARLCMPPTGMFSQKPSSSLSISLISNDVWGQLIDTAENVPAHEIANMRRVLQEGTIMPPQAYRPMARITPQIHTLPTARPLQQMQMLQTNRLEQHRLMTIAERDRQLKMQQRTGLMMTPQARGVGRGQQLTPLARALARPGATSHTPPQLMQQHVLQKPQPPILRNGGPLSNPRKILGFAMRDHTRVFVCQVCADDKVYETQECFKAHIMRRHFHTCGHCTAIFVFDSECRQHARVCRADHHQQWFAPDPRLPHVKTRCPFCTMQAGMVEMPIHLMDNHLDALEFELPKGRIRPNISLIANQKMVEIANQQEVPRLRYKYYLPREEELCMSRGRNCQVCGLVFPDPARLMTHLKYHPEFAYFCWVCSRSHAAALGTVTEIAKHIIADHFADYRQVQKFMPCPLCRTNMINRPLPHLMYECAHNLVCQLCRDLPTFESLAELTEHRRRCHYDTLRRFECSQCAEVFATTADFRRHICDTMQLKTMCTCGLELRTRNQFEQHFTANHLRGDVCKICNMKFADIESLKKHRDGHGKQMKPDTTRHLLICSFGDISSEHKQLLVLVSNTSIRMHSASKMVGGGTVEEPLEISDDDDIVELKSAAVLQEESDKLAAFMQSDADLQQRIQQLQHPSASPSPPIAMRKRYRSESVQPGPDAGDDEVVDYVVRRIVRTAVALEETDSSTEEEATQKLKEREEAKRRRVAAPPSVETLDDDDDDCVMLDESPKNGGGEEGETALSARIREEQEDNTVGGQGQPGYADEEEEADGGTPPVQPVVREFTPVDEDICVVGEVENSGCSGAAVTVNNQREKKFGCEKCSMRFMTQEALKVHIRNGHQFDAGASTISEELGIPIGNLLYICKNCCIAYPTADKHREHKQQHGQRTLSCDSCSGCAYNNDVMAHHHKRVAEKKVSYICGECRLEFEHETNLHEHSSAVHGVRLFYFCKTCEIGSTSGDLMYSHYMTECRSGYAAAMGRSGRRVEELGSRHIGVCPASQLHFQPQNVDMYRQVSAKEPHKFARPSLCNHRSLLVPVDRMVACDDCRCLVNIQTYAAEVQHKTGVEFDFNLRAARAPPPLQGLKVAFHNPKKMMTAAQPTAMSNGRMTGEKQLGVIRAGASPSAGAFSNGHGACATRSPSMATAYIAPSQNVRVTPGQQLQHPQQQQYQIQQSNGGNFRFPVAVLPAGAVAARGRPSMPAYMEAQQRRTEALQAYTQARSNGVVGRTPVLNASLAMRGSMQSGDVRARSSHFPPARAPQELSTLGSLQSLVASSRRDQEGTISAESTPSPSSKQCVHCNVPLLTPRDSLMHAMHTSPSNLVCSSCPITFANDRLAVAHMIDHLQPDDRQMAMDMDCPVPSCKVEMPTLIALRRHMVTVHNPPLRFPNPSCNLTFMTKELAMAHDDAHVNCAAGPEMQCCILCGTVDNWTSQMLDKSGKGLTISHLMLHALESTSYCKICLTKHDDVTQLVTHFIISHTNVEGENRSCDECGAVLETELEMKKHCAGKHMITELHVPKKLIVKIPPTMNDFFGIGETD
ncbi:hypothetical protein PFISCL1PPCAC_8441, partial [Pristionchus fissidentatus]